MPGFKIKNPEFFIDTFQELQSNNTYKKKKLFKNCNPIVVLTSQLKDQLCFVWRGVESRLFFFSLSSALIFELMLCVKQV